MKVRRTWLALLLILAACLDGSAVEPALDPTSDPVLPAIWTILLTDSAGHVWLLQSDTAFQAEPVWPHMPIAATLWTALDSAPALRGLALDLRMGDGRVTWSVSQRDGSLMTGTGSVTRIGQVPVFRGPVSTAGLGAGARFSAFAGVPFPTEPLVQRAPGEHVQLDAPAVLSLRADDCPTQDVATLALLRELRLRAEFAVPARLVGQPPNCPRSFIPEVLRAGSVVESHSRFHGGPPADFTGFYLETVGSAQDLRRFGADPRIFIQPGTWTSGPAMFDASAKLATPYGALLRRVYAGIEAYVPRSSVISLPASGWTGPAPNVLSHLPPAEVDSLIRDAAARHGWIEFMWHSAAQPLEAIAPQLRVIAALRDSGLIDVMPFAEVQGAIPEAHLP